MNSTALRLANRPDSVPEGTAAADVLATDLAGLWAHAASAAPADVERALHRPRRDLADFAALLSPAAASRSSNAGKRTRPQR